VGVKVILARDSDIRMMASSCRTVMGMDERSSLSRSTCWTSLRRETKWEESISDASADKRGAHRLLVSHIPTKLLKEDSRFAERNVSLHLLDINLSNSLILILPVHMDVHDVFSDCLIISYIHPTRGGSLPYPELHYAHP
jgi:hypothetical protein